MQGVDLTSQRTLPELPAMPPWHSKNARHLSMIACLGRGLATRQDRPFIGILARNPIQGRDDCATEPQADDIYLSRAARSGQAAMDEDARDMGAVDTAKLDRFVTLG